MKTAISVLCCLILVGCATDEMGNASRMFELQRNVTNLEEHLNQQRDEITKLKDEVAALRGEYIIKTGDSLKKIALQIGTTPEYLLEINPGLNGNRLKIGDVININRKKPNKVSEVIGAEAAPQPQH